MSDTLQTYRLYRMNALSGQIQSVEKMAAFSDDEAIGRALEQAGDERIELWRGNRRLAAISGGDGAGELTIGPAEDR